MFLLQSKDVPENANELARAIQESIRPYVRGAAPLVAVRPRVFPYYDEIRINLDKAELDSKPPPIPTVVGDVKYAFEAGLVGVTARNIRVQGVPFELRLEAERVVFDKGKDANDQAVLIVKTVREGHLRISAAQSPCIRGRPAIEVNEPIPRERPVSIADPEGQDNQSLPA